MRVSRQQVRPSVRLYPFPRASNSLLCVEYLSLLSYTRVYKPPRLASSKADIWGPLLPLLFFLPAFALADRFGDEACRVVTRLSGLWSFSCPVHRFLLSLADRSTPRRRLKSVRPRFRASLAVTFALRRLGFPYAFLVPRDRDLLLSRTTSELTS